MAFGGRSRLSELIKEVESMRNFSRKVLAALALSTFFMCASTAVSFAAPDTPESTEQRTVTAEEAVALLTEAAGKGQSAAMLSLGSLYENGIGVPRNYTKAYEWYKKAADAKQAEGYYNLGVCYEIGMGVTANADEAMNNFKKAADMKLPQAFYKLSSVYLSGSLVKASNKEAISYLNKASEAGHSLAANELGVIYLNGMLDQKPDGKKALDMFVRSADLGNPEAMKNIAVIYKDGLSRDKDPVKALKWYLIAQQFGYQAADIDEIITALKKPMKDEQVKSAESEAAKWVDAFKAKNADKS
ncbi:hypothetical protein C4J81_04315 [Deltaproteobacteria bacterium Smac51]|nr:hypothetical protein C4J81_04315 [Deltaproteobacteria bacterium Smac51]